MRATCLHSAVSGRTRATAHSSDRVVTRGIEFVNLFMLVIDGFFSILLERSYQKPLARPGHE